MKILFFSDNFPPETNAAATRVFERACYWVKWGHDVTVITCAPNFPQGQLFEGYKNRWHQTENLSGIRVVRVKTFIAANSGIFLRSLDFLSFLVTSFFAAMFEKKPDIVIATSPQFFTAVSGWATSRMRRVPFVFELGDLWPESISAVGALKSNFFLNFLESLELFLYRHSNFIAALTNSFKENLISRGIEEKKIKVVMNGVDTWRYKPQKRDVNLAKKWGIKDEFIVGYIGTHGMAHGLKNIIDTALLLEDYPMIKFILVGDGAERKFLISEVKKQNLKNVIFIPPQVKEAMPKIWGICNIALVHLRNHSTFSSVIPSKIFEAMSMGLPIILSAPDGESRRIIEEDGSGLWVPPEDPKALYKTIKDFYINKHLYASTSSASLKSVSKYSRENQAKKMIEVLELACMN